MKTDLCCGVFLIDRETNKLLIIKYTQSNTWSVPKGENASGEPYFSTAIRELYEETNISYGQLSVEHSIEYEVVEDEENKLKAYIIYIDDDSASMKLRCNKLVDKYEWVTFDDAITKLSPCQAGILKSL